MKIWPVLVKIPKWGLCEVRETTDRETVCAYAKRIPCAPRSHGFVNLFRDGIFYGWCGVAYARRRIVKSVVKLPKYIRDIPV